MESLKDLTYLLNRYAVRDIDVLTNPDKKKSKEDSRYWEFYVGLQKGKWKTEDEIAKHFGYDSKTDKGFRRLKEGLKERLLNTVLFLDNSTFKEDTATGKSLEMYRLFAISESLRKRGSSTMFLEVANKALNLAIEIDSLFFITYISNMIRGYIFRNPSSSKEYTRLSNIFEENWESFVIQTELYNEYNRIGTQLVDKKGYKVEYATDLEKILNKYEKHLDKKNVMIHVYIRLIEVFSKTVKHDWLGGLHAANKGISYFKSISPRGIEHLYKFLDNKCACLLMLKRYEEAILTINEALDYVVEGKTSWFKNLELASILYLYSERYQEAWDTVCMVLNHERFNVVTEVDQETWRLYQGYLYLIAKIRKESYWPENHTQAGKFRVSRWLNDLPLYSQDKRGGNIPLLILQVLFLLTEIKENASAFDDLCNRVEALRKYGSRNLDPDEEHVRTNCFIGMVQLLPKHLNNPSELQKASHKLLAKMQGYETDVVDTTYEVEVVPYERQWGWITDLVRLAADAPSK